MVFTAPHPRLDELVDLESLIARLWHDGNRTIGPGTGGMRRHLAHWSGVVIYQQLPERAERLQACRRRCSGANHATRVP